MPPLDKPSPLSSNNTVKYKVIPVTVLVTLLSVLGVREGDRHTPYKDAGGVLTVCHGLTGPDVVAGRYYSTADCNALEMTFAKTMTDRMGSCLKVSLSEKEWLAWAHWSWNIGYPAFCHSKAVRLLNHGDRMAACEAMKDFHYAGGKDCNIRSNQCYGLVTRRQYERAMCMTGL